MTTKTDLEAHIKNLETMREKYREKEQMLAARRCDTRIAEVMRELAKYEQ